MFKDIVCGVTTSGEDQCAVDAAIGFAQRFDAKLYLVHVAGMAQGWGDMETLQASGETERIKAEIAERLAAKTKDLPNLEIICVPGMPHAELLRIARKVNSDLIVMGPHTEEFAEKRSKMWGMAGSTLEKVSRRAKSPVMIVTKETPYGEHNFKHILVATDFSEQSECAVNYGGQMARQYKAHLTVVHCLNTEGITGQLPEDEVKRVLTDTRERLAEEYVERLRGVDDFSFEALAGKPSMEILKLSNELHADLVIMAHHSKETDPEKAFMGSTVTQVALNSEVPTMSVNKHFDLRCGLMYEQDGTTADQAKVAEPVI
ncbi:MAG: universal stress protein [Proteobacteria bacterium]|nr:universal stress protein [Pseudomonadota bacterium]